VLREIGGCSTRPIRRNRAVLQAQIARAAIVRGGDMGSLLNNSDLDAASAARVTVLRRMRVLDGQG